MCPWAFQRTYALPDPFTLILQTYVVNHQNFDRAWEGLGGHLGGQNLVGCLLMGTHSRGVKSGGLPHRIQRSAGFGCLLVPFGHPIKQFFKIVKIEAPPGL